MKIKTLICIIILAFALVCVWTSAPSSGRSFKTLTVKTAHGDVVFRIDLAQTERQKERGLMHRTSLEKDYGMLFLWEQAQMIQMWMRNTPLPLDMLFIDATGQIVYIAANTTPNTDTIISAPGPVRAVLEIAGGNAQEKGIAVGDRIIHRAFKP